MDNRRYEKPALQLLKPTKDMARVGDLFDIREPSEPAPQELYWTCATCGPIEPYATPMGRWIRRSCACEKQARKEREEAQLLQAWKVEQARKCYGRWLGPAWVDDDAIRKMTLMTFASFKREYDPEAYDTALAFAEAASRKKTKKCLVFEGENGSGKTHLSAAIANFLRDHRITSHFTTVTLFFKAYEDLRKHDGNIAGLLRIAIDTPVLFIDDIDKSAPSPARQDTFFTIFDERYKAGRPTVLSTNKWTTLTEYIGEAAFSRLAAKYRKVETVGGNYRIEEAMNDEDEEF